MKVYTSNSAVPRKVTCVHMWVFFSLSYVINNRYDVVSNDLLLFLPVYCSLNLKWFRTVGQRRGEGGERAGEKEREREREMY